MNSVHCPYALAHARRGQTMLEYVLIVTAVAVSTFAAYQRFSSIVGSLMTFLAGAL